MGLYRIIWDLYKLNLRGVPTRDLAWETAVPYTMYPRPNRDLPRPNRELEGSLSPQGVPRAAKSEPRGRHAKAQEEHRII